MKFHKILATPLLTLLMFLGGLTAALADPIVILEIQQSHEICDLGYGTLTIIVETPTPNMEFSIDAGVTFVASNHFEGLTSQDYLIIVRTPNGNCSETRSTQLTEAPSPEVFLDVACIDGLNRSVLTPMVMGGTIPYEYEWQGDNGMSSNDEIFSGVSPGTYNLTVTDDLGCVIEGSIVVDVCCVLDAACDIPAVMVDCPSEVPMVDPILADASTSQDDLQTSLSELGVTVTAGACGDLLLEVSDELEEPASCNDGPGRLLRTYSVSDAHSEISCQQEISIANAATPIISTEASDNLLDCDDDLTTRFEDWLLERGGLEVQGCSEPYTFTMVPELPVAPQTCGELVTVTFVVEDACGRVLMDEASFGYDDTTDPELTCPDPIEISSTDDDIEGQIGIWLTTATVTDNCSQPSLMDNYEPTQVQPDCGQAGMLSIQFRSEDDCQNFSECTALVTITGLPSAEIQCGADLEVECSEDRDLAVEGWMTGFTASMADGTPLDVTADLEMTELSALECGDMLPVTFTAIDACGMTLNCTQSISIVDNDAPLLSCPQDRFVDLGTTEFSIAEWLASASVSDCSDVDLTHNGTEDMAVSCTAMQEVTYTATDACGLSSSCTAILELSLQGSIALSCPEPVELRCSDPRLDNTIMAIIDTLTVTSVHDYEVSHDFSTERLQNDCSEPEGFSIEISVVDACDNQDFCTLEVALRPEPEIYIPNVISPDGDGLNDFFNVFGNESVDYVQTMIIYNRWGNKIFETSDLEINTTSDGWNGRYDQVDESSQVFSYLVEVRDVYGQVIERAGTIQVIR